MARTSRKQKQRKRFGRIAIAVIGGLVLLFGIAFLVGGDDEDGVDTGVPPVTSAPATTVPVTTVPTSDSTPTSDPASTDLDTTEVDGSVPTSDGSTTSDEPTTTVAPTTTTIAFAYGAGECPPTDGSAETPETFEAAPELCIDPEATYSAEVVTSQGSFTIELATDRSPGNVNNFVTLARWGYYDGTGCHRIIADFVVQCGRPGEDESAPGYNVPDELPGDDPYEEGMVAMANTGQPDTAGGQWFIITGENGASLPPQYTIIGTVTEGYASTVAALENLADPTTPNGVPPLVPVTIESVTITES